ncbi:CYFA0S01e12750g1_1 [Cyberlindnera fabianii]|uniref:polynucleotide adenylyltransferase n=1 Tax=Cyberlindnera fabianii TaxID=36022 RepID=A0A061AJ30_CYBFA|nr:CYFA0S01e12750g1_1 [Cyberlindnera fabianii]
MVRPKQNTKTKRTKQFLKKSTDRIKRSFDVFSNKNHENQYANLDEVEDKADSDIQLVESESQSEDELGDEDVQSRKRIKRDVILVDDYESEGENGHADVSTVIPDESTKSAQPAEKTSNELTDGTDFIGFNFSSDEDEDNEEDAYSMDDNATDINTGDKKILNTDAPWVQDHDHSKQKEIADWLTMEIKDFIAYISPSKEEIEMRNSCVRRLRTAITGFWTDCEVHVFGSYATDLYLPGSDIDMVIVSERGNYENRNELYSLSSFLKRKKLAVKVEVIAKAKVPIIKFTEPKSNIHIDVSFERTNGIEAAKLIRGWIEETPGLREIVLIVKQFLAARKLNNVHVGGLGGYSIICLVYSFLRLHPRLSTGNISPYENLGVLLIEFFELYGRNFGYDNVAISVDTDNVRYLNKRYYPDLQGRVPFSLAIQDPSDPKNNISRGSFNIRDIKKAFNGAYEVLINQCYDMENATYKQRIGKSILGSVVKYRGKERDFKDERKLVTNEALAADDDTGSILSRSITPSVTFSEGASSSEDEVARPIAVPRRTKQKVNSSRPPADAPPKVEGKAVDDYMGLDASESDEDEEVARKLEKKKSSSSIDKDARREFWLNKGNALA